MSEKTVARFIRITGLVQGVGFRPTVFVVAHEPVSYTHLALPTTILV